MGVGTALDEHQPLGAVECDLTAREMRPLPADFPIITFLLQQPFSPNDRWIGWIGSARGEHEVSIQVLNSETGRDRIIRPVTGGWNLGWAKDGDLYAFQMRDGYFLAGSTQGLSMRRKLHPGIIGAISPDGSWALVISNNGANGINIYASDMPNGEVSTVVQYKRGCITVSWHRMVSRWSRSNC